MKEKILCEGGKREREVELLKSIPCIKEGQLVHE